MVHFCQFNWVKCFKDNLCQFIIDIQYYLSYYNIVYFVACLFIVTTVTTTMVNVWSLLSDFVLFRMTYQTKAYLNNGCDCTYNYNYNVQIKLTSTSRHLYDHSIEFMISSSLDDNIYIGNHFHNNCYLSYYTILCFWAFWWQLAFAWDLQCICM